jgi:hypothetical protein
MSRYSEWIVWNPYNGAEGPEDGKTLRASDYEEAAKQWGHDVERSGCDYTLEETPEIVIVCPADRIANARYRRKFRVRAQTSRDYFADELLLT